MSNDSRSDADVLLLAAGFGTRLRPLTDTVPKPLVEVGGKPLIDWNLELIASAGFSRVFINLHHLGGLIKEHVRDGNAWGLNVEYFEEDPILDTGGAIRNVEPAMAHDYLVTINSDILLGHDFDLRAVLDSHTAAAGGDAIATMVLRPDPDSKAYGEIGIDGTGRVCSFLGDPYGSSTVSQTLMYLGVQVLSRNVVDYMPARGSVFSITRDVYPRMLEAGEVVHSAVYTGYWNDVGTPERLAQARDVFDLA